MCKATLIGSFLFLVFTVRIEAAPLFRFHSITDVLPSLFISSIAQDSRGFLWFGTQGGLVMYNGNDYTTFTSIPFSDNTLSSNLIQTMLMDEHDVLWIGTYAGLDRYDIEAGTFTNYSVGNDIVVSLLKDSKGRLWAGTMNGLGCLNPESDGFTLYKKEYSDNFIADNTIRDVWEDSRGTVYASTYDGLVEYNPEKDAFVPCSLLLNGNPASEGVIYGIREDASGDYWVIRWGIGLIKIDGDTHRYTVYSLKDNRTYCMNTTFDKSQVLIGTWGGGLNVFDKATEHVTAYTQGSSPGSRLTNDIVYSLFVDATGLLWLGTNGGGLNVYDSQRSWFSSVDATADGLTGIPMGKINALIEDSSGDIWISVVNRGVTRYNPRTKTSIRYINDPAKEGSLISDTVYCMLLDSHNTLYLGTDKGLVRFNPDNTTFSLVPWFQSVGFKSPQGMISSIYEGPDGSLWVGVIDNGIVRYFPEKNMFVRYINDERDIASLSDNLVYFTQVDSRGDIWIGTNRGLNRFSEVDGKFARYTYNKKDRTGISSNTVYSFYENTDDILWFGTRNGGLCSFDRGTGTFSHVTTADGLPSDTIVGICASTGNMLWAATQNGLVQYDTVNKTIFIYKTSDGLLSQQFNAATATTRDGHHYFGTPVGLVYFAEKDLLGTSPTVPNVALTSLMANSEHIPVPYNHEDMKITLKSDQRSLSIGYSALNFSPLARYSYSYRLDGFDHEWIKAGDRKLAMYTNLFSGTYLFRVRIDSLDFPGKANETLLKVIIEKPLYLRWYAILVYFMLLLCGVFIVQKIRTGIFFERKVGELEAATNTLQTKNTHLEELSYQDALTGISNRRYFTYIAAREWEAAKVRQDSLSVLMIDIDFFKRYNDTYGHPAGDEALNQVAGAIKAALYRVSDVVARYGGEEFIVILPDTNRGNAQMVCERIMQEILLCSIPFPTETGEYLTVSIGCHTGVPESTGVVDMYIKKADEALYRAKKEGRNKICEYLR